MDLQLSEKNETQFIKLPKKKKTHLTFIWLYSHFRFYIPAVNRLNSLYIHVYHIEINKIRWKSNCTLYIHIFLFLAFVDTRNCKGLKRISKQYFTILRNQNTCVFVIKKNNIDVSVWNIYNLFGET